MVHSEQDEDDGDEGDEVESWGVSEDKEDGANQEDAKSGEDNNFSADFIGDSAADDGEADVYDI